MRRPTVRRKQPGIALFPFLAVLICTMGALIVLLVLVVQQARANVAGAAKEPDEPATIDQEELGRLQEQEEDLQWRAGLLQEQRDQYAQDLANKRLELSHLEDHIRRLEDQAKKLIATVEELRKSGKGQLADRRQAKKQLAEMEREIEQKKSELDDARKEVLRRRPAYAIIPYDGPNGTSRRPMYVECTEEGIVLQPEGVVLSAEDFQGPLGPGNPLDAALRAAREHLKRAGLQSEPYPLIIVRPSGALAFGACRTAMKHWESEFGYELVDQDAELKYPPPDPQLAATLERAVKDARQRQYMLASAMPNRFGSEGRMTSFRAADNPDIGAIDDGPGVGQRNRGDSRSGVTRGVPSVGSGGTGMGTGPRGATGSGGNGASGQGGIGDRPTTAATSGRYAAGSAQSGTYGQRSATGGGNSASGSSSTPGNQLRGGGPSGQGPSANGGQSYAGGVAGGTAPSGASTAQSPGGTSMMSSGARSGSPGSSLGSSGGNSAGSSGDSASNQVSTGSAAPSQSMSFSPQMQKARKAIKSRGENWGLPNASPKATGITRPIRVECHADQLKLLPEKGEARTPLIVPIEDDLTQNLDALVDAVWRHMDRWGLAVVGGYWKPVLAVNVQPGGEQRFAELQQLLRGSGIEVERK